MDGYTQATLPSVLNYDTYSMPQYNATVALLQRHMSITIDTSRPDGLYISDLNVRNVFDYTLPSPCARLANSPSAEGVVLEVSMVVATDDIVTHNKRLQVPPGASCGTVWRDAPQLCNEVGLGCSLIVIVNWPPPPPPMAHVDDASAKAILIQETVIPIGVVGLLLGLAAALRRMWLMRAAAASAAAASASPSEEAARAWAKAVLAEEEAAAAAQLPRQTRADLLAREAGVPPWGAGVGHSPGPNRQSAWMQEAPPTAGSAARSGGAGAIPWSAARPPQT